MTQMDSMITFFLKHIATNTRVHVKFSVHVFDPDALVCLGNVLVADDSQIVYSVPVVYIVWFSVCFPITFLTHRFEYQTLGLMHFRNSVGSHYFRQKQEHGIEMCCTLTCSAFSLR